jgi:hypothetical protein
MNKIEKLASKYEEFCKLPWDRVAAQQRTWFVVYPPELERRIRRRYELFELATKNAKRNWCQIDLTDQFAQWISESDNKERYFKKPKHLTSRLRDFHSKVVDSVNDTLLAKSLDDNTVVALTGIASLFGFMSISSLVEKITPNINGRLLVFFPGEHEGNTYRLLDGQEGWNYLAVPITL